MALSKVDDLSYYWGPLVKWCTSNSVLNISVEVKLSPLIHIVPETCLPTTDVLALPYTPKHNPFMLWFVLLFCYIYIKIGFHSSILNVQTSFLYWCSQQYCLCTDTQINSSGSVCSICNITSVKLPWVRCIVLSVAWIASLLILNLCIMMPWKPNLCWKKPLFIYAWHWMYNCISYRRMIFRCHYQNLIEFGYNGGYHDNKVIKCRQLKVNNLLTISSLISCYVVEF